MFEFKAHIWDNQVYIGDRAYTTNEILTAYLNQLEPEETMTSYLRELEKLLTKVQILDDDYDREEHYNRYVQRTQKLFFYVGGILQKLPPYKNLPLRNKLDQPLLFDCLNVNYHNWETGDFENDSDDVNEYGFLEKRKDGSLDMYVQRFQPDSYDVRDCAENELIFFDLNREVEILFNEYTRILKDLIRAKTAYAEFLDNYIHRKNKFLSDGEIAKCFVEYVKDSLHRQNFNRLIATSAMKMSHEVYRRPDGKEKLCETYTFDSIGAFLYFDFFRGLSQSYLPKRCDNCGQFFLLEAGKYSNYCERTLKDDPDKTCRDIGARKKYDDKCKTDPVWLAYNRAYKTHYARYMKKKMTIAEFEQWSRQAVEWRTQVEEGKLEQSEYECLLKK